ncbi:MAG TPA: PH domain-containing protein [Dermatophilaceae bacterium]|nr:PH domain-containing protein [Actinomycetales bacterium]HMT32449.1 PH domain-containing protein [Dermatophilaceae bacterium]HMT90656.1 PH domain-containing protein [Dermatophilaceae bacterium]
MSIPTDASPFEVFRPRRGRFVAIGLMVAVVTIFTFIGFFIEATKTHDFKPIDRVFFASIGWVLALLFWRYATIRAIPSREGLVVRNLFTTRTVTWPQVVAITFEHGMPWPSMELSDTESLAVMAIQRSDGKRSLAECSRLVALAQGLGEAAEPQR